MKYILVISAIVSLLFLAGCDKDKAPSHAPGIIEAVQYDLDDKLESSIYYAGNMPDYLSGALGMRSAVHAASMDDADIIVVESKQLEANKTAIEKAWNEGRMIVELWPDNKTHYDFWKSIGAPYYLTPDAEGNDLLFLAVHEWECYQLQNPFMLDGFLSDVNVEEDDNASETTDESEKADRNYATIPVEIEEDSEYLNTKLASFVDWANDNMEENDTAPYPVSASSSSFDGDLSKRIDDSKFSQHITKTLNIGADDYQICKVVASTPDKVTRHSTIDVNVTITPLYVYSECNDASVAGDYYFVTMHVISHNAPLYGIYKEWHGWVRTYAHVFYSDKITFSAQLENASCDLSSRVSFFETPKPASTQSSTSYTVGFTKALNVNAQGGISNGKLSGSITVGGAFTWSNSYSRTVADQSIEMSSLSNNGLVSYNFVTNNVQWEDETQKAIPAIARTDQKCEASWCWRVSGTKDDDKEEAFRLHLYLYPLYGCQWRHATWGAEGDRKTTCLLASTDKNLYFPISLPNRTRNGVVQYKNTSSNYVNEFKIYDSNNNVVASGNSAYEKNTVQKYQIPVGIYTIKYDVNNGDTGKLVGHYQISNVVVNTAKTTELTHLNATKVD